MNLPPEFTLYRKIGAATITSLDEVSLVAQPGFEPNPCPERPGADLTVVIFPSKLEAEAFARGFALGNDHSRAESCTETIPQPEAHVFLGYSGDSDDDCLNVTDYRTQEAGVQL